MKCACNPVCRNYSTETPYSPMNDYCDPCIAAGCDAHGYCQTVVYRRPVEPGPHPDLPNPTSGSARRAGIEAVVTARSDAEAGTALESWAITPACRTNRGIGGAWDEAVEQLRQVYDAQVARFGPTATLVLSISRERAMGVPAYVYSAALDTDDGQQ